eukprot:758702-Hanusia_phi.AAC.1
MTRPCSARQRAGGTGLALTCRAVASGAQWFGQPGVEGMLLDGSLLSLRVVVDNHTRKGPTLGDSVVEPGKAAVEDGC